MTDLRYKNGGDSHCMTFFVFKNTSLVLDIYLEANGCVHKETWAESDKRIERTN